VTHIASGVFTNQQRWAPEKCHYSVTIGPFGHTDRAQPSGRTGTRSDSPKCASLRRNGMAGAPMEEGRLRGRRSRAGVKAREQPGRWWTATGQTQKWRSTRHDRPRPFGGALPVGAGTPNPESGAPPRNVPGRRHSWPRRRRRPRADGTRDGAGVFPICGALRPLSCGYPARRPMRRAKTTHQLIALSARSERLRRSLPSWARSAGRSRHRPRSERAVSRC